MSYIDPGVYRSRNELATYSVSKRCLMKYRIVVKS